MRTPGRCTNLEGCWISASGRNVWLSVGEDFACPNCRGALSPPLPQARSYRLLKRAAGFGAVACLGLAVGAFGMVELSKLPFSGHSVRVAGVHAPGIQATSAAGSRAVSQARVAEAPARFKPLTTSADNMARDVVASGPNSPFAMQGISAFNASARAAHARMATRAADVAKSPMPASTGPLILYAAPAVAVAGGQGADAKPGVDDQRSGANTSHAGVITVLSQADLSTGGAMDRPVFLPISFGRPTAPESDAEPVTLAWHHHGVVTMRHSGFLPAPAESRQAAPDALAQICRIPSLMH